MWRPCPDWPNRRWCEVALNMPQSTLQLREERVRRTTLASWVECLVGLITAIGTSARYLPDGNIVEIAIPFGRNVDGETFMETVCLVWQDLMRIGIPMPMDRFTRSAYCGLRQRQILDQSP